MYCRSIIDWMCQSQNHHVRHNTSHHTKLLFNYIIVHCGSDESLKLNHTSPNHCFGPYIFLNPRKANCLHSCHRVVSYLPACTTHTLTHAISNSFFFSCRYCYRRTRCSSTAYSVLGQHVPERLKSSLPGPGVFFFCQATT